MPRSRAALLLGLVCVSAFAGTLRHDQVTVVPAPKPVVLDGDLGEWDRSGAIESAFDEALRPRFVVTLAFMYDADAFYIGAHFNDETPLRNAHDPQVEPERGWAGDCLQLRLCSDPAAAYPLPSSNSDRICHLTIWHFTDRKLPVLQMQYGMDYHRTKVLTGADSGVAFRPDPEAQGYSLEARIPWERLNAKDKPPKAGDKLALVAQPLWSDSTGTKQIMTFNDVLREAGFSFQGTGMWGQAVFSERGNLAPAERAPTAQEALEPLTIELPVPDAEAVSLSAALFNAKGLVRTLPVQTASTGAKLSATVRWDGLDNDGQALPPGEYRVEALSHRGIGQKYLASLHNAGNPPWRTDDNTGSWGGDHGAPNAAASDAERVYLGWEISEAGWAIIACETKIEKGDDAATAKPKKLWGQHQVLDTGMIVTALASDGERLFVAQDGKKWGEHHDKAPRHHAGIVLWEAKTGKPINFPFGKRVLDVCSWQPKDEKDKPLWERVRTGDIGPQNIGENLKGLAVSGDTLYVSRYHDDKVAAYDWKKGTLLREYAIPKPAGLAAAKDSVLVVSGKQVLRLNPETGDAKPVVTEGLASPFGVAVSKDGRIFVSDCGDAMQVKVFDAVGKLVETIGKAGGRPWAGRYDPKGMLKPAGLTVDAEEKVWVTEFDHTPKRVSVWSPKGKLIADLLGPGAYAVEGVACSVRPQYINLHSTVFELDYDSGKAKTLATLIRPELHGHQFAPSGGCMGRALKFAHYGDHSYAVWPGYGSAVVYRISRDWVAEPVAALGYLKDISHCGITKEDFPAAIREQAWRDRYNYSFVWTDENADTFVQPDEFVIEKVKNWGEYWGPWITDDLTIWSCSGNGVWRVPVKEVRPNGVPVYPKPSEQQRFVTAVGDVLAVMPWRGMARGDASGCYVLEQKGGDSYGKGSKWQAVASYAADGTRLWEHRQTWTGFGLESPLFKPGYVIGAMKFIGTAPCARDGELLAVNGYFGQFNVLSSGGLWVTALCKDNRYGPKADETTVWPENFSGWFYRNADNGKTYLIAGDTDARVWEVTGLDTIRTARRSITLTEADREKALQAALRKQGLASDRPPLRMCAKDDANAAVTLDAGAGRSAKARLWYDQAALHAVFEVRDDSPMKNSGADYALLFKSGDSCNVMLATNADADPKRAKPAAGDIRLLFSVLEGKPVCVLYEAVASKDAPKEARTFSSPTGAENFERVLLVKDAEVKLETAADGYTLRASVPLKALPWAPKPGVATRGDIGVIFSDPGGARNVLRAYHANKDTAIVNDIPSEARLEPQKWGVVKVE
jgi:hypothetical protein